MNENQRAAYIFSQAACALIEAMEMFSFNQQRLADGFTIGYDDKAFRDLITGIDHNSVVAFLRGE